MSDQFDLKSIERRAFRSTFEDGLWDMYLGLVVAAMAVFMYRPASGYSPLNIILAVLVTILAYNLYRAGKRYITLPRMGQVRFGPIRKQRKAVLAFVLGGLIVLQVGVLLLTVFGWLNPDVSKEINATLIQNDLMDMVVASIGALFVGTGLSLVAFFNDVPRGYYNAFLISLAVFLMVWLNQPVYPLFLASLVALPGLVLFIRFLRKYPLPNGRAFHA
jgi:hypothetical protein